MQRRCFIYLKTNMSRTQVALKVLLHRLSQPHWSIVLKCTSHIHSCMLGTKDLLQTTAQLIISKYSTYCLRHVMTLRKPFPHGCLFMSDGIFYSRFLNSYPLNSDSDFHSLIHKPSLLHFAQMCFQTNTGVTTRCVLLFQFTLSHNFKVTDSIFVSPKAVVPTVQDSRGNPAKVGEGLAYRGSITQVINSWSHQLVYRRKSVHWKYEMNDKVAVLMLITYYAPVSKTILCVLFFETGDTSPAPIQHCGRPLEGHDHKACHRGSEQPRQGQRGAASKRSRHLWRQKWPHPLLWPYVLQSLIPQISECSFWSVQTYLFFILSKAIKNSRESTRSPRTGHELKRTYDMMEGPIGRAHLGREGAPCEGIALHHFFWFQFNPKCMCSSGEWWCLDVSQGW